jgi:pre-mRNA-splicing factor ATP-dependent RNA helicase DHX16
MRRKKKKPDEEETKMSNLTEEERADLEREKDKRERDEFAKRLVEKDKKKQRQLDDSESDDSRGKQEKEALRMERLKKREDKDRRLARGEAVVLDSDDEGGNSKKKAITISDMRAESRRAYLQKRTKRELELLERELQDEEEIIAKLGGSSKMTAEEQRELQLKRDILRMAREHGHVDTDEAEAAKKPDGFYRLPEDYDEVDESGKKKSRAQKGEELLTSRYVEPKQEKSEQQLWEEGQTQKAAGLSKHKKKKRSGDEEDDDNKYDFVFEEEQIDFVCVDTNKGYDNRKKRQSKKDEESVKAIEEGGDALEMRPATKHEKILEGRKKLPVYPYR